MKKVNNTTSRNKRNNRNNRNLITRSKKSNYNDYEFDIYLKTFLNIFIKSLKRNVNY